MPRVQLVWAVTETLNPYVFTPVSEDGKTNASSLKSQGWIPKTVLSFPPLESPKEVIHVVILNVLLKL